MNFTIRDTTRERFRSQKGTWVWMYEFTYDTDDMKNCVADLTVESNEPPTKEKVKEAILANYKMRVDYRETQALIEKSRAEIRALYAFCFEG